MTSLTPELLAQLRADVQGPDDDVADAACYELCEAGDPVGVELVIDRFIDSTMKGKAETSAEWALHRDGAFDTLVAVAERDPGGDTAQAVCYILGETSCYHSVYPVLPTLMRVLEARLPRGTKACWHVLDAFRYLSRKGPMPEAAPLLRAVLRKGAEEPDCHVGTVGYARRALYVTEGDAIIPELRALIAGLPESHELRLIVEGFIERREAGLPDMKAYPLPWETPAGG